MADRVGMWELHHMRPPDVRCRLKALEATARERDDRILRQAVAAAQTGLDEWQELVARVAQMDRDRYLLGAKEAAANRRLNLVLELIQRICRDMEIEPPEAAGTVPGAGLVVRMLGTFEVALDGRPVSQWHGRRTQTILQLLVVWRGRPVSRDALIDMVWPDAEQRSGRRRLHQGVYALRRTLSDIWPGCFPIQCVEGGYQLDPRLRVWTDVAEFQSLAEQALRVEPEREPDRARAVCTEALALYRGDFLAGEGDLEWAGAERESLRTRYALVANRLARVFLLTGETARAVATTDHVLAKDPWNEESVQLRMRAFLRQGNAALAIRAFHRHRDELMRELGVGPAAETVALLAEALANRTDARDPRGITAQPAAPVRTRSRQPCRDR